MGLVIRRKRKPAAEGVEKLLADTQDLIARLVKENRTLKSRNQRLSSELERVTKGWDEIKRLARSAPRRPRRP